MNLSMFLLLTLGAVSAIRIVYYANRVNIKGTLISSVELILVAIIGHLVMKGM